MIVMIALFKSFLVELVCFRFYLKSFFLDGHGTKYKKCMGTQNPRFFPLMGTVPSTKYCWAPGSCPSVKILSKSVGHGSLGVSHRKEEKKRFTSPFGTSPSQISNAVVVAQGWPIICVIVRK